MGALAEDVRKVAIVTGASVRYILLRNILRRLCNFFHGVAWALTTVYSREWEQPLPRVSSKRGG